MEKTSWEILSEILKKEVESSNYSLLHISISLGIDKTTLDRYLSADFSGPEIYVKNHLAKLKSYLNIEEDLYKLYKEGVKEVYNEPEIEKKPKERKYEGYLVPVLLLLISILVFVVSLNLFFKVFNAPILKLRALDEYIMIDNKKVREVELDVGVYNVSGPGILETIDKQLKRILMDNYQVVIKWEK
ncbi:MAG: hypothetical protein H0Z24_02160 [Thermosipho sp. (in: Bacteria)]|nr:hypothetical protein [Thermosipho sp. (in: thermotogales)]